MNVVVIVQHHAGALMGCFPEGTDVPAAMYEYVRASHDFLDDDNHIGWIDEGLGIEIITEGGARWFSQGYFVATEGYYTQRLGDLDKMHNGIVGRIASAKDTISGRKLRDANERLLREFEIERGIAEKDHARYQGLRDGTIAITEADFYQR